MTIPCVINLEEIGEFLQIVLEQDQRKISRVHPHVVFLERNPKLVKYMEKDQTTPTNTL